MIQRSSGKQNINYYTKTASTPYTAGTLVYSNGAGGVTVNGSASAIPLGIMQRTVSSTDGDYALTTKVPVDVFESADQFTIDYTGGTPTAAMVGGVFNLNTAKDAVDLSRQVPNGVVRITSLGSGGTVFASFLSASNAISWRANPSVVLIGDSITGRSNYVVTATSITQTNGIATVTATAHALFDGAIVFIGNANEEAYNGMKTVISRTASNTFTFAIDSKTPSPATGSNIAIYAEGRFSDRNWFEMANSSLGHPFSIVCNVGVSGQTTTDIAARFQRDALSQSPTMVQIQGGINDIQSTAAGQESTVLATMQANILRMINICISSGVIPLVTTVTPLESGATSYTAARGQMVLKYNNFLRELAAYQYPQMILFDAWAVMVDPASATANSKSGYMNSDGIHPNALGCQEMAQSLAGILDNYGYAPRTLVGSIFDSYDNLTTNNQVDPNPLNTGTAGTKATAGAGSGTNTGNVPDNYTCTWTRATTGTCVNAVNARGDGFGNDLECTAVSADANDAVDIVQTSQLHARVSPGDVLMASANITVTSITNMSNISYAFEWAYNNASGSHTITQPAAIGSGADGQLTDNLNFTLFCPPFTVPSGGLTGLKTRVKMTFAGVGGAVLTYGRHSIVKVTAPPMFR